MLIGVDISKQEFLSLYYELLIKAKANDQLALQPLRSFQCGAVYYNAVKMAPASGALNPLIPGEKQRNGGGIEDGIAPRWA